MSPFSFASRKLSIFFAAVATCSVIQARGQEPLPAPSRGDAMNAEYFRQETARLADACLADVESLADWEARRGEYRRQLFEMLGLDPQPERTELQPVVTGRVEHPSFIVEKLHFQSLPGLYVTGNLYLPRGVEGPVPAVLYVCGHARVKEDGIAYGNKAHYQHHGGWLARHGLACLVIDTVELGEIEGEHHGTYTRGMWWWNSVGYTPAGVEAWNAVRALDYLQTRPEIDGQRLGVTGRSGGGATSWWIAALDDRIRCAVPVAGITDLTDHVVNGVVEGHCDCMYMLNAYRWDFPLVAALIAPRPLLITNTDKDGIFPLGGVVRLHEKVRRIYDLYGAGDRLGLQVSEGGHVDSQELQVAALHWLNRYLRDCDPQIDDVTVSYFRPQELKVFESLPTDETNTTIHERLTQLASPPVAPDSTSAWEGERERLLAGLREKVFRGWPMEAEPLDMQCVAEGEAGGLSMQIWEFTTQGPFRLRAYAVHASEEMPQAVVTTVLDEKTWPVFVHEMGRVLPEAMAGELALLRDEPAPQAFPIPDGPLPGHVYWFFAPRGIGLTASSGDAKKLVQIRRRYMLLGQTLAGMQAYDIARAMEAAQAAMGAELSIQLAGVGQQSAPALFAAILGEAQPSQLWLGDLPATLRDGPDFLNVLRVLDAPQAVALAADRCPVRLAWQAEPAGWEYVQAVGETLGWPADRVERQGE